MKNVTSNLGSAAGVGLDKEPTGQTSQAGRVAGQTSQTQGLKTGQTSQTGQESGLGSHAVAGQISQARGQKADHNSQDGGLKPGQASPARKTGHSSGLKTTGETSQSSPSRELKTGHNNQDGGLKTGQTSQAKKLGTGQDRIGEADKQTNSKIVQPTHEQDSGQANPMALLNTSPGPTPGTDAEASIDK